VARKIWVCLCLVIMLFVLVGCGGTSSVDQPGPNEGATEATNGNELPNDEKVDIAVLKGPTGMGIVKLMGEENYNIQVLGSPDDLIGKIVTGEVDLAAVPPNLAAILYQNTGQKIQLLAVHTLGALYILENGENVTSLEDLQGRTLYVSGKGATPDYVIQYLLQEHGLVPGKDVTLDYISQHTDLAAIMAAEQHDLALLPQPHVTSVLMQNKNVRIALDLNKVWKNVLNKELTMGVLIGQKNFIDNNQNTLAAFLEEYEQSIKFVNNNMAEAAELIAQNKILPNAEIAEKAIPYCNIVYIDAQQGKTYLENFYSILYDFNPDSIGGKIPDDEFYYSQ